MFVVSDSIHHPAPTNRQPRYHPGPTALRGPTDGDQVTNLPPWWVL